MFKRTLKYIKYGDDNGYDPEQGSFACGSSKGPETVQRSGEWHGCREEFDNDFPSRSRIILFYDDEKRFENVSNFIAEVEKRLKVEPKTEILGFEKVSNVCCVRMSKWWMENDARRQLFTILLRCGFEYNGKNFEDALYSHDYIDKTCDATKKFFDGYTHCALKMRGGDGWVDHFSKEYFDDDYEDNHYNDRLDDDYEKKRDAAWERRLGTLHKPKK